jgi:preprotein translocase subunit SecG
LGGVLVGLDDPQAASATVPTATAAATRSQALPGRSYLIEAWSSREQGLLRTCHDDANLPVTEPFGCNFFVSARCGRIRHHPRGAVRDTGGVVVLLSILLMIASVLMVMLVLLHRGKGGGLSNLFGGGVSSSVTGSSVVEKNLDRFTIICGLVWAGCIIGLGLLEK